MEQKGKEGRGATAGHPLLAHTPGETTTHPKKTTTHTYSSLGRAHQTLPLGNPNPQLTWSDSSWSQARTRRGGSTPRRRSVTLDGQTPELTRMAATSPRTASLMAAISTPRGPESDGKEGMTPDEAAERGKPAVGVLKTGARPGATAAEETIRGGTGTKPKVEAGMEWATSRLTGPRPQQDGIAPLEPARGS